MTKTKPDTSKGSNFTRPGTLTVEQLKRHKLTGDFLPEDSGLEAKIINGWCHRGKLKSLIQQVNLYRLTSHGVTEAKTAKPLVLGLSYFLNSLRQESRVNRDKTPQSVDESGVISANLKDNVNV
jgi:hypothetical protein